MTPEEKEDARTSYSWKRSECAWRAKWCGAPESRHPMREITDREADLLELMCKSPDNTDHRYALARHYEETGHPRRAELIRAELRVYEREGCWSCWTGRKRCVICAAVRVRWLAAIREVNQIGFGFGWRIPAWGWRDYTADLRRGWPETLTATKPDYAILRAQWGWFRTIPFTDVTLALSVPFCEPEPKMSPDSFTWYARDHGPDDKPDWRPEVTGATVPMSVTMEMQRLAGPAYWPKNMRPTDCVFETKKTAMRFLRAATINVCRTIAGFPRWYYYTDLQLLPRTRKK